jgi:BASS family bile acid:Na+ symporter
MHYADLEYFLSIGLLSTAMLGMGATLTFADFRKVAQIPQAMLLMYLVQVVISPIIALGIARLLHLPPGITLGLVFIAALPGGLCSNIFTYLGKGNIALSVSATALTSLTCLVTTSVILRVAGGTNLPSRFQIPTDVVITEIILCMILPLVVGMVIRQFAVNHYRLIGKFAIRVSMVLLVVFAVAAINSGHIRAADYGWRPPLAFFLFCCANLWVCYGIGSLARMPANDRFTIGLECVVRNVQLGVLLKAILFPPGSSDLIGDAILYTLLIYGSLSISVAGFEVVCKRFKLGWMYRPAKNSPLAESTRADRSPQIVAANHLPVAEPRNSVNNVELAKMHQPGPFAKSTHEDLQLSTVCLDTNASDSPRQGFRRRETTDQPAKHRRHSD